MQLSDSARPAPIAVIGLSRVSPAVSPDDAALRALENSGIVPEQLEAMSAGVFATAQADLIATRLGAVGPVLTLDALPAGVVHLACQSINAGESVLAFAGILTPGAGGGFLVLKAMAAALADDDPIHCTIDGSALGRGEVVRQACARAGADRDGVQFLWRRGYHTGAVALESLSSSSDPDDMDDAVTALLDMPVLLSRRHIPLDGAPLTPDGRLTAVLSSVGSAGTACALVMSEPPARRVATTTAVVRTWPLLLSAETEATLLGKAESLRVQVAEPDGPDPLDAAHTLAVARPHLPYRAVILANDREELTEGLSELAAGRGSVARAEGERKVAFLFPGEGGQRLGMGRELYPLFDVFADALDEVCHHLEAASTWSVRGLLLGDGPSTEVAPADEAMYAQDALFALQMALFRQFEHWGVHPDFVAGHSVGELAAATAAGVYSLPDVCALLAERVRLFRDKTPLGGAMVAMRVSEVEALESLAGLEHLASISAVNAPNSVVVSGDRDTVLRIAGLWSDRGRKVKQLPVDRAFHSPHMAAMAADFEHFARTLSPQPPNIPLIPVHTSLGSDPGVVCLPEYWGAQVRGTGHFLNCVNGLDAQGVDTYVDMSASGILAALVEETLPESSSGNVLVTAALRGGESDERALLTTLGELHSHGVPVDWREVFRDWGGRRTHLTTAVALPPRAASRPTDLRRLIRAEVEAVIKGDYGPDRSFFELGLDSMAGVALVHRLRRRTGLKIATSALFDHPTPNRLAAYLDNRVPQPEAVIPRRSGSDEPIAIVGMSCRFPGGVNSPEDLWRLIVAGRDVVSPMPHDRGWDLAGLHDPQRRRPNTTYVREGGFLHDAAGFDPAFFGIGRHEALEMDPQQRLLLELSWEAFERAGIDPVSLRSSDTGVFAGLSHSDYGTGPGYAAATTRPHLTIGTAPSVACGRISFTFGLQGPSLSIDTACSSSLVGLHLAVQAMRRGECSLALAGAVTVMASPLVFVEFSRQGGLAPDARVKPFAEDSDGTVWSEGGGMFVLERYSDARRNNHPVLALITGSAVNSDGASNGLTAPNGAAQHRMLLSALADAQLRPSDVDVVEAHGTGTRLGDPIEAAALVEAYGAHRLPDRPLLVGSVKSNLGHPQAAAGAAGVIKMVLAMRHGLLPATINVDRPSSHVDWGAGLRLVTEQTPWPDHGRVRRAGVSSFGIGGTNAHVILQQPPAEVETPAQPQVSVRPLWTVSGASEAALRDQAGSLAAHWDADPDLSEHDIGFSLATTRSALTHRAVLTGSDRDALRRSLTALAAGRPDPDLTVGSVAEGGLAFLLTGQGSQRLGMGRQLYATRPVFTAAVDEVCAALGRPVVEAVFGMGEQHLERTEFAQPALFTLEVALFRLLESWGVRPDMLLGHSLGELTAAHLAGVLSLPDACKLVAARGSLMQALPEEGAMYAVAASQDEVTPLLPPGVSLAAVNGPRSVVISGTEDAVVLLADRLRAQGRRTQRLRVSHAFHSSLMEPALDEFRAVAESLTYHTPEIPVVSGLTGRRATTEELCSPEYWVRQARGTVRFLEGIQTLRDEGAATFLELGPGTTLTEMASDILAETGDAAAIPVLRNDDVLGAVAALHVRGHGPDFSAWYAGSGARRVDLPTYRFQRERLWLMPDASGKRGARTDSAFWEAVEREDLPRLKDLLGTDTDRTFSELLPAIARWRHMHDREAAMDPLRYRISWQPVADQVARPQNWMIAHCEHLPVPKPLSDTLGTRALPIRNGADRAEIAELLASAADGEPVDGVLSLLALDERNHPGTAGVPAGLALTTALIQAVQDAEIELPLWCATQGAVSTGHGDRLSSPVQAAVWGLGRVAALEHPQRWGGLVDLPPILDARAAERLAGVLTSSEDQVAVRSSGVFVRRMLRAPVAAGPRRDWPLRGTTLITGAFGALGRHLARWLAAEGVERLLLTGRHTEDGKLVAELTRLGAEVDVAACDVADREAVTALLARIPKDRPLTTVVHAAGVLDDGVIDALDPQRLARVLRAKAEGARNLHELAGELKAFVMFSSATGAIGNAGQANYAAANAYLDALSEQRRADGLPATSVAWGPWGNGGMAVDGADAQLVEARLRRNGMAMLDPELAVAALVTSFAQDESGLVIADVDWERFLAVFATTRRSPLLADLPEARQSQASEPFAEASSLARRLAEMSRPQRARTLRDLVCHHTMQVLGRDSVSAIRPTKPFHEQGLNSLGIVELRNQLRAVTGVRVPASALFDHPTPHALAEYLETTLVPAAADHPERRAEVDSGAADIDSVLRLAEQELSLAPKGGQDD
ncbi:type I polyketide synthase [Streptomyces sp. NBC_00582]|uniref:type I polyketide synthase n=1 Tax=Streptomyces sp. NBC_00582 TaxID=2975783 RepID=UPI002E800C6A|nr:SDR family NAD(P)-dependent oxidoreductase [Streptomyces sp. NBC_00582]WUB59243.1 SDR family NAD(P)-dependent oxidoreductase [Streptomyces sp. NBC_00582]